MCIHPLTAGSKLNLISICKLSLHRLFLLVILFFTSITAYSIPITDTVTGLGDGKEWAQINLFTNLSWDTINTACPAGVCTSGTQLNGYKMDGWTWASVYDVGELYQLFTSNFPGGFNTYIELGSTWATTFLSTFQYTYESPDYYQYVRGWAAGDCFIGQFDYSYCYNPMVVDYVYDQDPDLMTTSGSYTPSDLFGESIGAWFFRTDSVPEPSALLLLSLGLLGLGLQRRRSV